MAEAENLIDHFTVMGLVAWPLHESEAGVDPTSFPGLFSAEERMGGKRPGNEVGVDLVLIETSMLFSCKFLQLE